MSSSASSSDDEFVTPVVLWAQSKGELYLKLLVPDAVREKVAVKVSGGGSMLTVTAPTTAANGKTYKLELQLYSTVMPLPGTVVVQAATSVSITLAKTGASQEHWPRLLADGQPVDKNKIKINWDIWQDPEADSDAAVDAATAAEKIQLSRAWAAESARISGQKDLPPLVPDILPPGLTPEQAAAFAKYAAGGEGVRVSSTDPNAAAAGAGGEVRMVPLPTGVRLKASYLLAYNLMVLIGAFMIVFLGVQAFWLNVFPRRPVAANIVESFQHLSAAKQAEMQVTHNGGFEGLHYALSHLHARVGSLQYAVQALASLEVFHSLIGLIPGRVLPSVLLNGGRDIVLFGLVYALGPEVSSSPWTGLLYLVWCVGDTSRFLYYLMALLQSSVPARLVADGWMGAGIVAGLVHQPSVQHMQRVRYMLPLFLLPLGFIAELGVLYAAMGPASAIQIPLPGLSLTLAHLLPVYAAFAYLLGAPFLYMAVLKQGRSKLGNGKDSKKKNSGGATTAAAASGSSAAAASAKKAQ